MKEMILLGAGASVEAKVPIANEMTVKMLDLFSKDQFLDRQSKVLRFVVGGLLFNRGIKGDNPILGVNIEDVFNAIEILGQRQVSELEPFISSWHPALNQLERGDISRFTAKDILKEIYTPLNDVLKKRDISRLLNYRGIDLFSFSDSRFRNKLTDAIDQVVIGGQGELFHNTNITMINNLINMVWVKEPERVEYLKPLLNYAKNNNAVLATLNYDNTIELVAETLGLEVDSGFEKWSKSGEFTFNNNSIHYIKLHGSINWSLNEGQTSKERPLPYQIIEKIDLNGNDKENYYPEVIFGGRNKITAKGPFLSLLRVFEKEIEECELLTVIGYSFRDDHVNEYLNNWFNNKPTRRIRIINPDVNELEGEFIHHLLNTGFELAERLQLIKEPTSIGINQLVY